DLEIFAQLVLAPHRILQRKRNRVVAQYHHSAELVFLDTVGLRTGKQIYPRPRYRHAVIRFAHIEHDALFPGDAVEPAGKVSGRASCRGGRRDWQGSTHSDSGHDGGQSHEIPTIEQW